MGENENQNVDLDDLNDLDSLDETVVLPETLTDSEATNEHSYTKLAEDQLSDLGDLASEKVHAACDVLENIDQSVNNGTFMQDAQSFLNDIHNKSIPGLMAGNLIGSVSSTIQNGINGGGVDDGWIVAADQKTLLGENFGDVFLNERSLSIDSFANIAKSSIQGKLTGEANSGASYSTEMQTLTNVNGIASYADMPEEMKLSYELTLLMKKYGSRLTSEGDLSEQDAQEYMGYYNLYQKYASEHHLSFDSALKTASSELQAEAYYYNGQAEQLTMVNLCPVLGHLTVASNDHNRLVAAKAHTVLLISAPEGFEDPKYVSNGYCDYEGVTLNVSEKKGIIKTIGNFAPGRLIGRLGTCAASHWAFLKDIGSDFVSNGIRLTDERLAKLGIRAEGDYMAEAQAIENGVSFIADAWNGMGGMSGLAHIVLTGQETEALRARREEQHARAEAANDAFAAWMNGDIDREECQSQMSDQGFSV